METSSGIHAIPTRPSFQAKIQPMIAPPVRVAKACTILDERNGYLIVICEKYDTYAPSVTPARPLIFCGFSLRADVS